MPSIPLDTKHWTRVAPGAEDESVTVTARGFACYYSNEAEPPELTTEGTELTEGTSLTFEVPRWFRAKETTSTEAPTKPTILEVTQAAGPEGESVGTAQIDKEAVTAAKIATGAVTAGKLGAKAVTAAKALEATVPTPAAGESLTAVAGTAGVTRTQNFAYTAKAEASAKVKLVHTLATTAVVVTAYSTATKIPVEALDFAAEVKGAIAKVKIISATEVELTLAAAVPGAKEEFIYIVAG